MIEINNTTRAKVSETFLRKTAQAVLESEGKESANISIALVGAKKSAELNKQYRKKDKAANVLSFPMENNKIPSQGKGYLGEVIICPQEVKKEAVKYGIVFTEALAWMLVHGILHLLGYDHKREADAKNMEQKEQSYLSCIKHKES